MEAISLKNLVIPILSVILSGSISWYISQSVANRILNDRLSQGQQIFQSVGYRYFHALFRLYKYQPSNGNPTITNNLNAQSNFRIILNDINQDIRWLRTNPLYVKIIQQSDAGVFPILQNAILEHSDDDKQNDFEQKVNLTTELMCRIYTNHSIQTWGDTYGGGLAKDLQKFTGNICCKFKQ